MINAVSFIFIGSLNLGQTVYPKNCQAVFVFAPFFLEGHPRSDLHNDVADAEFVADLSQGWYDSRRSGL